MKLILHLNKDAKRGAMLKRLNNINFISSIPREGLEFNLNERQLLIEIYSKDEYVSIQYPDKESKKSHSIPGDFRAKIALGNYCLDDLSFGDIGSLFYKIYQSPNGQEALELIACELYRIVFLIDFTSTKHNKIFLVGSLNDNSIINYCPNIPLYHYTPNLYIIDRLNELYPLDYSWESFFLYNDLLSLNEDCKYYYMNLDFSSTTLTNPYSDKTSIKKLKSGTGRPNTMLTHINIINALLNGGVIKLIYTLSTSRGVSAITNQNLNELLSNYM